MTITQELDTVKMMIALYCKKKHRGKCGLCIECSRLSQYVNEKLNKCPFKDKKTFCSNCRLHCYNAQMREKIQAIMRFAGSRMILYHPIVAFRHIKETLKIRRRKHKNGKIS